MKVGSTILIMLSLDVDVDTVDSIIFTMKNTSNYIVVKNYPDDVSVSNRHFTIPLTQEETIALGYGMVEIEGQVNFKDKSVVKSRIDSFLLNKTLNTKVIEGNSPCAGHDACDVHLTMESGVVIAKIDGDITPEMVESAVQSYLEQHPIDAVTESEMQTYVADALDGYAKTSDIPSLDGYATETYVSSAISNKADKSEIPSLSGYATQTWVEGKGYLTEHQSLDGYATETYVTSAISGKADRSELPTVPSNVSSFTNDAGYLTEHQSLTGYATEEWVEDKGYLTEHQSLKTINGESIVGTGNIHIEGGSGSGGVTESEMETYVNTNVPTMVDTYVTEHKSELKGDKGDQGIQGVPGYTPIKGVDYFDGSNGEDGSDGFSPEISVSEISGGHKVTITDAEGEKSFNVVDGQNGSNGTSCTHSWNGTVLTITSSSGSSSADLKGQKGDDGHTPVKGVDYFDGQKGDKGDDGHTPVKGTDYWTSSDKAEIVNDVLNALPSAESVTV